MQRKKQASSLQGPSIAYAGAYADASTFHAAGSDTAYILSYTSVLTEINAKVDADSITAQISGAYRLEYHISVKSEASTDFVSYLTHNGEKITSSSKKNFLIADQAANQSAVTLASLRDGDTLQLVVAASRPANITFDPNYTVTIMLVGECPD